MNDDRFSPLDWDEEPTATQRVELHLRLANAKNEVAARMGWHIAFWAALAAHLKWTSWPITLVAAIGLYLLATYGFKQDVERAKVKYVDHTHQEPDFM
jgi:hypothetical protein